MEGKGALAVEGDPLSLVNAAKAGDHAAFDRLVRQHSEPVFRLALRMLGDRQDAEDVQQEAFVLAYRHLPGFRGEASFKTWIYTITARLCLSRRRRRARRPREAPRDLVHAADSGANPEDRLLALEAGAPVEQTLLAMPRADRLLIVLKCIEGLSHEEVARILRCSVQSSRARLLRAKRIFRERYERLEAED